MPKLISLPLASEAPTDRPDWAWWGRRPGEVPSLRHAIRVLRNGAPLERSVFEGGGPLDRALQRHQRANRSMGRTDRVLLGTAVYGLARNREMLRQSAADALSETGDLLALALLDALGEQPEALGLPRDHEGTLRAALSRLATMRRSCSAVLDTVREEQTATLSQETRSAFHSLFSLPDWWLDAGPWETLGQAVAELSKLKAPQSLCLRVQPHRGTREEVLAALAKEGIPARPTLRSPWGVVVTGRHNVLGTDLYRAGKVEVQDEGSQLVACLCDPKPGERVLDLCAGAGGKSLALGAALGGKGSIVAYDTDRARLSDARKRARRSGLGNIRVVADWEDVQRLGPYDLVLVDAPCSSSGTLRRNPDVAWRWTREHLVRLVSLQAEILDRGAALVAPGKTLVYATCSLLAPENGGQVESFLARHPGFGLQPPGERYGHRALSGIPGLSTGSFRLAADLEGYEGDAFFAARFQRHA